MNKVQRSISLNSFLIAIILNLSLLIVLSLIDVNGGSLNGDRAQIDVSSIQKVSLVKGDGHTQRRPTSSTSTDEFNSYQEEDIYLPIATYRSIVRELAPFKDRVAVQDVSNREIDELQRLIFEIRERSRAQPRVRSFHNDSEVSSLSLRDMVQKRNTIPKGIIKIPIISNSADPDNIAEKALKQLSKAINSRQFGLKVDIGLERDFGLGIWKKHIDLSDPAILDAPLIYLVAKRPFSFTEDQTTMLTRYLNGGGLLLFSNVADTTLDKFNVDNSFGFELWKVLGDKIHNLSELNWGHELYNLYYRIPIGLPPMLGLEDGKLILLYEDSGYAKEWVLGSSIPHQQLGINIILYSIRSFTH